MSPFAAFAALSSIPNSGAKIETIGRNELSVLKRFELVTVTDGCVFVNTDSISKSGGAKEAIWAAAKNENSLLRCTEILQAEPNISVKNIAAQISDEYNLNWSAGSKTRNGGILRQWSLWIKDGIESSSVPTPPGRPNKSKHSDAERTGV
ncbi:hypothetical protein P4S72_14900 [Vibrio sp. PP-XX7]